MVGHHDHHFAGDEFANAGFWSPPTSAANFCEEDYSVTYYVAEFVNCLSSFAYVYYALGYPIVPWGTRRIGRRFDSFGIALCLIGVTSAAFHGTLRQGAQFSDDLSMLVFAGCVLQAVWTHGQAGAMSRLITGTVIVFASAMSVVYVRSGHIPIHMATFSGMVLLLLPRTMYLIYVSGRSSRSDVETAMLARRFWAAFITLLVAFAVWNVDLEKCLELRAIRNRIGLPWAWLLELHGWWHVLTAIGAIEYVAVVRLLCNKQ